MSMPVKLCLVVIHLFTYCYCLISFGIRRLKMRLTLPNVMAVCLEAFQVKIPKSKSFKSIRVIVFKKKLQIVSH